MNNVKLVLLLVILMLCLIGCGTTKTEVVYRDRLFVQTLPNSIYTTAKKPTTFKEDINLEYLESVEVTDEELIKLLLHKYAVEKDNNVACYKTVYNIKTTLAKQKEEFDKGNVTP